MKKMLDVNWNVIGDKTGYMFSLAKSLSLAVKNSPHNEKFEDIVATSGFAFRMWISHDLCPSATSIWDFNMQPLWVKNGGILTEYTGRYWGQDDIELEKRTIAIAQIKDSIDKGTPAVAWEVGVLEWGIICGYDDEKEQFDYMSISGERGVINFAKLGNGEIPLLSVLTVTGYNVLDSVTETARLAVTHLSGGEWSSENKHGLSAYPEFIDAIKRIGKDSAWNVEYFLGAYAPLKEHAAKYFVKNGITELGEMYTEISENWHKAFDIVKNKGIENNIDEVICLLENAYELENKAFDEMKKMIS